MTVRHSSDTADVPSPRGRTAHAVAAPDDVVERELRGAGHDLVAGVDEVGRGAWAGPVVVVAAMPGADGKPEGLTDSKLLSRERREGMFDALAGWCDAWALGSASAGEIDRMGMTAALRLAAVRALESLPVRPDAVILDGAYDYLGADWTVRTVVKGDQKCVSVAAASVLAKVRRDRLMARCATDWPAYGFGSNAGYPSPTHRAALAELGPTDLHRMSWRYWDDLPRWRHLRVIREADDAAADVETSAASAEEPGGGQLAFDLP